MEGQATSPRNKGVSDTVPATTLDQPQDRTGSNGKQVGSKHGSTGDRSSCRRLQRPQGGTLCVVIGSNSATTRGHTLCRNWEQLLGGGLIQTNPERTASPVLRLEDRDQASALTIRSIHQEGTDKENTLRKAGGGATCKGNGHSPDLASMDSLRGPLARQNRAKFYSAQGTAPGTVKRGSYGIPIMRNGGASELAE
jgi:hypothetical protein